MFYIYSSFILVVSGGKNISPNLVKSRSRKEPYVFGPLELEPLEKKILGAGAGAAWEIKQEAEPIGKKSRAGTVKISGYPALPECTYTVLVLYILRN